MAHVPQAVLSAVDHLGRGAVHGAMADLVQQRRQRVGVAQARVHLDQLAHGVVDQRPLARARCGAPEPPGAAEGGDGAAEVAVAVVGQAEVGQQRHAPGRVRMRLQIAGQGGQVHGTGVGVVTTHGREQGAVFPACRGAHRHQRLGERWRIVQALFQRARRDVRMRAPRRRRGRRDGDEGEGDNPAQEAGNPWPRHASCPPGPLSPEGRFSLLVNRALLFSVRVHYQVAEGMRDIKVCYCNYVGYRRVVPKPRRTVAKSERTLVREGPSDQFPPGHG